MRERGQLAGTVLAVVMLLLALPFPAGSRSSNPCEDCHRNYTMYLDIVEDDPLNSIPAALGDGETLTVAVVLRVTSNTPEYKDMSSITATLASQKGLFSVVNPTFAVGSLSNRQTATATWHIRPMASGTDVMTITAQGVNRHGPSHYSDSFSPSPVIKVTKAGIDLAPTISLTIPAPGERLSGGRPANVSWVVTDEDVGNCTVALYYSSDGFATVNGTIASGLPAGRPYAWTTPVLNLPAVSLRAAVIDPKGHFNETIMDWTFELDSTPPSVKEVLPAQEAPDLTDSAILQVRFSEPVNETSAVLAFSISPDPGGLAWHWNAESTVMTSAHRPFSPNTNYNCSLAPGVLDLSLPGNSDPEGLSWSFSTPEHFVPVPSAVMLEPSGGEGFYWGDRTNVTWTASGGVGNLSVDLSISENGTEGPFLPLAGGLPNNGSFEIDLPELVSDACLLEVTVTDENRSSTSARSGPFSIARDISLQADLPPEGSAFLAGNSTTLTWNVTGGHGAVAVGINYLGHPGAAAQVVQLGLSRSGSRRWTAPEENTGEARIIVNATDEHGRWVEASSGPFTVFTKDPPKPPGSNRPPVVVLSPAGGRARPGDLLTFDASGSFDPDGDPLSFVWYFGDGTELINTTDATVSHVYAEGGDYPFLVIAGDGQNATTQPMTVHIETPPLDVKGRGEGPASLFSGIAVIAVGISGLAWSLRARPARAKGEGGGR